MNLVLGYFGYKNGSVGSAIITVLVIHIIIVLYIWTAIKEERAERRPVKADWSCVACDENKIGNFYAICNILRQLQFDLECASINIGDSFSSLETGI